MLQQTNLIRGVVYFICGLVFVLPSVASARQAASNSTASSTVNFCSRIDALANTIMKDITQRETRYAVSEVQKQNQLTETLTKRDSAKIEARATWDHSHDELFANLRERAKTKVELAAVNKFQDQVNAAVGKRRTAIDQALETFRTGVDSTLTGRKSGVEEAIKTFRASADAALTDAKASCASGTESKQVRESYVSSLNVGRQTFLHAVGSAQKRDDTIKKLVQDRDARAEAANSAFKKELYQAESALLTAFPDA